ncbi:hypothetical protein K5E40_17355 [Pseudomonas baetica]|uniref:hypothetical protein n=1 Tax=Pseudomonas baetica TaxID=674054 RepID=UPI001C8B3A22|nr:hypothetical protein [Pseudomonas baetica]MBX9407442.1 hypothetical protein [Pseudomonas baetica]
MKILIIIMTLPLLTGCSWGLLFIKEGAVQLSSHHGLRRATLIVEVPENYSASYKAYYKPRTAEECQIYSVGTGTYHTRGGIQKSEIIEASPQARTAKFKVPLTYHLGTCTMNLSSLNTSISSIINKEQDSSSLNIVSARSKLSRQPAPEKLIRNLCGPSLWLIPEHAELKKLSVSLRCTTADQHWQIPDDEPYGNDSDISISLDELKVTPIRYVYRRTSTVRPQISENWMKFDNGWKPCKADWKWLGEERCAYRNPQFTKFLMNDGRVCTIYPGCTE